MERIMSQEERIKRAEEIYERRKNQDIRINTGSRYNETNRPEISLFKNLIIKITICAIIYTCFYTIKNSNYFFSEDLMNKVNEVLSYDINFNELYQNTSKYFDGFNQGNNENLEVINKGNQQENITRDENAQSEANTQNTENAQGEENTKNKENTQDEGNTNNNKNEDGTNNQEENNSGENSANNEGINIDNQNNNENNNENSSGNVDANNNESNMEGNNNSNANENSTSNREQSAMLNEESLMSQNVNETQNNEFNVSQNGIGGSDIENSQTNESLENLSQMEKDAIYVKNNFTIISPTQGVITSRFGPRTPTDIISANHAGLDIGNNEGTKILACMDGKVVYVSSEGDYGNHIKIQNGNVVTLYAHCSKIYVQEGMEVTAGTEIAEMGSTGRATGPHLHLEIKVDNRLVDPEKIVEV